MPGTTYTVSSSSEERQYIYPGERVSCASASVHSPESVESHSGHSSVGGDWLDLGDSGTYDELDSSGASLPRSKQHTSSRRHQTEAPSAPSTKRATSRHVAIDSEEPERHSSHHHHRRQRSSRPYNRSESRRVPSDESGSVASADDYPYYHGLPRGYSGFRHVPAPSHGGYQPSMVSAPGYPDPFQGPQALIHMPQVDPYGYPTNGNVLNASGPNPFSPMASAAGPAGYFAEPQMPPQSRPQRPLSMYSASGYGSDMYAAYPQYPQVPYMYPPSQATSPSDMRMHHTNSQLEQLGKIMKQQEEASIAREKAIIAETKAHATAVAAKEAQEKAEALRKEEIAAASAKAKSDAEAAAKQAADKAKEESDKKLAEAEKAKKEAEDKKKELEEQIKKTAPLPDASKEPIKFKDVLGRKFSFPWGICKTWKGMEGLIRQAFQHVDDLGPHVYEGHYDLVGPDGEIILSQVWDTTVQPGWDVEMVMWPVPGLEGGRAMGGDAFHGLDMNEMMAGLDVKSSRKSSKKDKKSKRKSGIMDVPMRGSMVPPPPPMHGGGGVMLPPGVVHGPMPPGAMDPVVAVMGPDGEMELRSRPKSGSSKSKKANIMANFMAGGRRRR